MVHGTEAKLTPVQTVRVYVENPFVLWPYYVGTLDTGTHTHDSLSVDHLRRNAWPGLIREVHSSVNTASGLVGEFLFANQHTDR